MNILITGPIGSGKTTQAKLLSEELGFSLIQTGGLIRSEIKKNSPEANEFKELMLSGHLVDDKQMAKLVKTALSQTPGDVILDSYPRRLSQLSVFDPQIDLCIFLDVPDSTLEQRLLSRKRIDDQPEIIEKRLLVYHQETTPLLNHYKSQSKLIKIDASSDINQVKNLIKQAVQSIH